MQSADFEPVSATHTLLPSLSKAYDFYEIVKDLENAMNSTHQTARLRVGHEMIRSQHAAMTLLIGDAGMQRLKMNFCAFLKTKNYSEDDAHFLVYGTPRPASRMAQVVEVCKAGFNVISDRVVEPPLRFVLKRVIYDTTRAVLVKIETLRSKLVLLPPDRRAPQPPAQQQEQAAATPRRAAPPRPPKPAGTAELLRRLSQQPQQPAPVPAPLAPIDEEPAREQPAVTASRCACISRIARSAWNTIPEGARKWVTKTLVNEFIKDPIHDIAQKTTAGIVLYVSGALTYAVGGAIVASAGAVGSAIAGATTDLVQRAKST